MARTLGVLGGMGPAATVRFMDAMVKGAQATRDQEHVPTITRMATDVPSRLDFLEGIQGAEDPFPLMSEHLIKLAAEAKLLAIPCNTVHAAWYPQLADLAERSGARLLHIVDGVSEALKDEGIKTGRIGLLASTPTVEMELYPDRFAQLGLNYEVVVPGAEEQRHVHAAVTGFKAGNYGEASQTILAAVRGLRELGCQTVVLGCTEFYLALQHSNLNPKSVTDSNAAFGAYSARQAQRVLRPTRAKLKSQVT